MIYIQKQEGNFEEKKILFQCPVRALNVKGIFFYFELNKIPMKKKP